MSIVVLNLKITVSGYIEASLRHFEPLEINATKHVNFDKMRIKKVNRTHHLFLGELEVFQEFGNEYKVAGLIYKSAGNDYKLMPYKLGPDGWCEFLKSYKNFYDSFQEVSDFPVIDDVS